jgi:hypothetical protein
MINFKSFKWGYGVVVSLVFGLSGCYIDGQNHQHIDASQSTVHVDVGATGKAKATTTNISKASSKEPMQKATPGPKRAAAPQLPVIQ